MREEREDPRGNPISRNVISENVIYWGGAQMRRRMFVPSTRLWNAIRRPTRKGRRWWLSSRPTLALNVRIHKRSNFLFFASRKGRWAHTRNKTYFLILNTHKKRSLLLFPIPLLLSSFILFSLSFHSNEHIPSSLFRLYISPQSESGSSHSSYSSILYEL